MHIYLAFAESIQLVPDGTMFVHIGIIILMVYLLNRILFRPVGRVLSERDRRTRGSSTDAHGIMRKVDEGLARYEQTLREARVNSYRFLETHRGDAIRVRQQKLGSVREELGRSLDDEKAAIRAQAEAARAELKDEAKLIANNIRNQILGRSAG
jgi:F-type H+-transporting ATPase subunit b